MERVIFRTEYDPYMKMEKYLAVFPDDQAFPGRIAYVPLYFTEHGTTFECYDEMSLDYYYGETKIVHKNNEIVKRLLNALRDFYGDEFRAVEKR